MNPRYLAIRAAFELFTLPGVARLIRARSQCRGVIFTLHRVLPEPPAAFAPNAILQVTPDFLEQVIVGVRALGFDIVPLDEALARIASPGPVRPFVVLTFDDAWRDNLVHALPVLRKHGAPFTLYVPTALVDGTGEVWWQALEDIVAAQDVLALPQPLGGGTLPTATVAGKGRAYDTLYWRLRRMPEPDRVAAIRALATQYGYDLAAQCRDLIMNWDELRDLATEPLCTIGAHTVHHYELAKLPRDEAAWEIAESARLLREKLGVPARHLSYPIGGAASAGPREFDLARELGFASAVTTRPGGLYAANAGARESLPRISLNGLFQQRRYVGVFATGAVFSRFPGA